MSESLMSKREITKGNSLAFFFGTFSLGEYAEREREREKKSREKKVVFSNVSHHAAVPPQKAPAL
jgi:hypothetical protein